MKNKILIIDTDDVFTGQCTAHLEGLGIDVLVSSTGTDGLRTAKNEKPGAVILDITLPYLNGFHVCKQLKSDNRYKDIPVLFISSREDPDDILNSQRVGGDLFLRKPIDADHLTNELIQILQKKNPPKEDVDEKDTGEPTEDDKIDKVYNFMADEMKKKWKEESE